jgi:hypothetical protein
VLQNVDQSLSHSIVTKVSATDSTTSNFAKPRDDFSNQKALDMRRFFNNSVTPVRTQVEQDDFGTTSSTISSTNSMLPNGFMIHSMAQILKEAGGQMRYDHFQDEYKKRYAEDFTLSKVVICVLSNLFG